MKRYLFAAAAATVAVSLGASAPAASAAANSNSGKTVVHAEKRLAVEKRKVLSHVAHEDAALARVAKKLTHAEIAAAQADAVAANVSGDRAALGDLGAAVASAATVTEVRAIGDQVRDARAQVYSQVVNRLRQAARFEHRTAANTAAIADLTAQADAKELEGYDVTAVRDALASAATANDAAAAYTSAAVDKGLALTAFSSREDEAAFRADLAAAGESLDAVEEHLEAAADALAAMVPAEELVG